LLRPAGLKVLAFALKLLGGEVAVKPPVSVAPKGIDRASLPKLDIVRCIMGVVAPEPGGGMIGDCGRPRGVLARKEGTLVGVYGRNGNPEFSDGDARARAGVRWGA